MMIIFWFIVLLASIPLIIYGVHRDRKMAYGRHGWRTPEEAEDENATLAEMRATRLSIVEKLEHAANSVPYVPAEEDYEHVEPVEEDQLSKFDASNEKSKQKSSSRASKVVKSKRGRRR